MNEAGLSIFNKKVRWIYRYGHSGDAQISIITLR